MTNEQINERISKLCGWIPTTNGGICWDSNGNAIITYPNYAESLDMCCDFERTLDVTESTEYAVQLRRIVTRNAESEDKHPDTMRIPDGRYYCAKPIERCEGWLSLKGQWE